MKSNLYLHLGISAFLLFIGSSCSAQSQNQQPVKQRLDKLLQTYHDNGKQLGIVGNFSGGVLVYKNGKVIYKQTMGYANHPWKIKNTTDTKFTLCSVSKQFTAMAILRLVNAGKLRLHDKISKYLPNYPAGKGNKITVHHLLSHSSGVPHYSGLKDVGTNFDAYAKRSFEKTSELVKLIGQMKLVFEPGSKATYSSFGYILLAAITENITGKPFHEVIQQTICQPLGMVNTGFAKHKTILSKYASPYNRPKYNDNQATYYNAQFRDKSNLFSTGGIYSTINDFGKWVDGLLNHKLLPAKLQQKAFSAQKGEFGYGWIIDEKQYKKWDNSQTYYCHNGSTYGFRSNVVLFPKQNAAVVILANHAPVEVMRLTYAIAQTAGIMRTPANGKVRIDFNADWKKSNR